jgi:hypothetical protein
MNGDRIVLRGTMGRYTGDDGGFHPRRHGLYVRNSEPGGPLPALTLTEEQMDGLGLENGDPVEYELVIRRAGNARPPDHSPGDLQAGVSDGGGPLVLECELPSSHIEPGSSGPRVYSPHDSSHSPVPYVAVDRGDAEALGPHSGVMCTITLSPMPLSSGGR